MKITDDFYCKDTASEPPGSDLDEAHKRLHLLVLVFMLSTMMDFNGKKSKATLSERHHVFDVLDDMGDVFNSIPEIRTVGVKRVVVRSLPDNRGFCWHFLLQDDRKFSSVMLVNPNFIPATVKHYSESRDPDNKHRLLERLDELSECIVEWVI